MYRKGEPIPDDMKFDGWQTTGKWGFPVNVWIEYRRDEPIPEDMKIEGW